MILHIGLMAIALAGATPSAGQDETTTAEEQAQFDLLMKRRRERLGIPPAAAGIVVTPVPGSPVPATSAPQPSFAERERERATEFNKQFGDGAYEGITGFSDRCKYADGCNKLATADLIKGAYQFVDLQKDVEKKTLAPDSDDYRSRHSEIKSGLRTTMEGFRPRPGGRSAYERDFIKFSDPIVKKIFSPAELLRYAERNAAASDSAAFYTYLGQALNGAGPPGKARAAFDAALERDPSSDAALSGRAEARLRQGDYSGAVRDAVAALKINPRNDRAYATLKFSEGRVPGAAAEWTPPGGPSVVDAGAAPGGPASMGGSPAAAYGLAGGTAPFDSLRRSDGLVADARRSMGLGDADAAVRLLSKAVELNPSNAEAMGLAAMAHIRLKNYPEALAAAEAGLKLAPDNGLLLDAKANALNYMKDYRGALAAADLAVAADPGDAMAHYNRAWALGGLKDREGALASLRAAARLNPQFAPALDSALSLPLESDIIFMFPGEKADSQPVPAAEPSRSGPPPLLMLAGLAAAVATMLMLGARLKRKPAPPPLSAFRKTPELLDGKFEMGREIGAGGMGVVYLGRDRSLDRVVAIKRMREEIRWDSRERARFIAEAKLVARLRHPHIVEIHTIVEQDGEVYLIFEHIAGRTLHEVIERDKKLPFEKARDLFRGVASALDYAQGHGVIHRDLKPANLMVDGEGRVRVMDFGIARLTEEALSRHSKTNSAVGTPQYMAPEQEQGVARKESDVYAMALCLYELLTGRRPFAGMGAGLLMNKLKQAYEPPSKLDARLPPGLDDIFRKALDPDPDKRYTTAGNLLRALEGLETPRR
ncbi:MAG: protein kinase [Elusimicrobia bacterium]|nr:protein kinase [Elusimicrobiota bacterium]